MEKSDADKMMYSFWQRGWIEIRELEKQGKNGREKEYTLKVRLDEIVEYLNHGREGRSAGAKNSLSKQEVPVLG
jgi:predicted transcriptional regulator